MSDAATTDRPYTICHMTTSVDGRIKVRRWTTVDADAHDEAVQATLAGDAWMCGRVTMQGYADSAVPLAEDPPEAPVPREDHVARADAPGYAVALDARGVMEWGARNAITGDHVVVVTTGQASDDRLRRLRAERLSYILAGEHAVDFPLALRRLKALFGIERLLIEGGGRINGARVKAGSIDEVIRAPLNQSGARIRQARAAFERSPNPPSRRDQPDLV